jgi:hypothetical protein
MNKHCQFKVSAVIDTEGVVRDLKILGKPDSPVCPSSLEQQIRDRAAEWRFQPGRLAGKPVAVLLQTISMSEPLTETEYAAQQAEEERHRERMKAKPVE